MQNLYTKEQIKEKNSTGETLMVFNGKVYDVEDFPLHDVAVKKGTAGQACCNSNAHSGEELAACEELVVGGVIVTKGEFKKHSGDWIMIECQVLDHKAYLASVGNPAGKSAAQIFEDINVFPPFLESFRVGYCPKGTDCYCTKACSTACKGSCSKTTGWSGASKGFMFLTVVAAAGAGIAYFLKN